MLRMPGELGGVKCFKFSGVACVGKLLNKQKQQMSVNQAEY